MLRRWPWLLLLALLPLAVPAEEEAVPSGVKPADAAPSGAKLEEAAPSGAKLTVIVSGFAVTEGPLLVTLYDSEEAWLDSEKARQRVSTKVEGKTVEVAFDGLEPGRYAVSVVHDANDNGKLDMRWLPFPKPKEKAGSSNNPGGKMGPPKWKESVFELAAEPKTLDIKLR